MGDFVPILLFGSAYMRFDIAKYNMSIDFTSYRTFEEVKDLDEMQRMVQDDKHWELLAIRIVRPEPEESGAFKEKFVYLLGTTSVWP